MYDCERCGASFSPLRVASPEACPRCLAREGVRTPLSYSLFGEVREPSAAEAPRMPQQRAVGREVGKKPGGEAELAGS
jgi:hypothetical protein